MASTDVAASATAAADTQPGFCEKCFTGFKLDGQPAGKDTKIGPFDTYVTEPAQGTNPETAIIFWTDVFGLKIDNPRLMADKMAETTGITVYVPDIFFGEALDGNNLSMPETAEAVRSQGILAKAKMGLKMVTIVPWFLRHKPDQHLAQAEELVKVLKTEKGIKKLGAVGYCYGAIFTSHFNATGDVQASVFCHPSMLKVADFEKFRAPVSFALAEEDGQMAPKLQAQAKEVLKRKEFDTEFVVYDGTAHGFACRPNLAIEDVKKGFEGSLAQTCSFFKKHLF